MTNPLANKYFFRTPKPSWLCYIHFDEKFDYFTKYGEQKKKYLVFEVIKGIISFFPVFLRAFFISLPRTTKSVVVLATTKNQQSSVQEFINNGAENMLWLESLKKIQEYPVMKGYVFYRGLLYLPVIIYEYFTADAYTKSVFVRIWSTVIKSYGLYSIYKAWFNKNKRSIKAIVVSNDHVYNFRAFYMAANSLGVKTIYIPHSSVTNHFPCLEFTAAFLDGKDMLNIYQNKGRSSTKIFLSGPYRYFRDIGTTIPIKDKTLSVGLCIKTRDNLDDYIDYISKLLTIENAEIILRPHPSEKRSLQKLILDKRISLSDATSESSLQFLDRVKLLISGSSNILLECLLKDTYPIFFDSFGNGWDNYSFVENGIVEKMYTDFDNIVTFIKESEREIEKNFMKLKQNIGHYIDLPPNNIDAHLGVRDTISEIIEDKIEYTYFKQKNNDKLVYVYK